jgi:SM-20-related protein
MSLLDLAALRRTPLVREPFDYLIVPGFLRAEVCAAIHADYPPIDSPGSFPLSQLRYGPAFGALIDELQSAEVRQAFEEKFGVDLRGRPTMITVRGHCGPRDGRIHTDTPNKILTVLLYMNPTWEETGGRLRLLRSAHDLEDVLVEVPPLEGTLLAFRRSDNSWHGHKPFVGPRRVIQLNWITDAAVLRRELWRHRLSAWFKQLRRWLRPRRTISRTPLGVS